MLKEMLKKDAEVPVTLTVLPERTANRAVLYKLTSKGTVWVAGTLPCVPGTEVIDRSLRHDRILCSVFPSLSDLDFFVGDTKTGTMRPAGRHSRGINWLGWSPDGLFTLHEDISTRRPFLVHLPSASMRPVPLPAQEEVLYTFWRPLPHSAELVIAMKRKEPASKVAKARPHIVTIKLDSRTGMIKSRASFADAKNPMVLRSLLGEATGRLLSAWAKKEQLDTYTANDGDVIISKSGHKAFGVIREFWRQNQTWATPDRALCMTALGSRLYVTDTEVLTAGYNVPNYLQWTSDERSLFYLWDDTMVWLDPVKGTRRFVPLPKVKGELVNIEA